jgi:c-di-GMP-binding flagellar brake protein YcgR
LDPAFGTPQPDLMSDEPTPFDELEIAHPTEIAAWLSQAQQANAKLELQSPQGDAVTLGLLRVDRDAATADLRWPGMQATALPAWLASGPVQVQATLDKIRMDFELGARSLLAHDGPPVLRIALPAVMRRHQRRQAFRVPPANPHFPRAFWQAPQHSSPLRLALCDLSAGGLGLLWPAQIALPSTNALLEGVDIELERGQRIAVTLRVEHLRESPEGMVLGCAFVGLPPMAERNLLQHLNQAQRRRRALGK